ncbi:MAG: hypothetical protein KAT77_01575 [Nanoarchaeota archaeon]|nr:hypothetical protein [Nanoarchaeota archaeon]
MKSKLEIQNTRFVKELHKLLGSQFGFSGKLDYVFLKSTKAKPLGRQRQSLSANEKGKVYIISKDVGSIDLNKLRINTVGFYLGELKGKEFRLSLEGCSMIGSKASKNIVNLEEQQMKWYFEGLDLEMDLGSENRFVLLKFGEDFIGCCKYKDGKVLNFLPKEHRTSSLVY